MAGNESLSTFAGPTGVGALCFLGIFLILDGRVPTLFPALEAYSKTTTWTIIAAVPVLAITYLTGLVLITTAGTGVRRLYGPSVQQEAKDTVAVSMRSEKDSILAQRYMQLQQERETLAGAALSLIVLAFGALSERRTLADANAIDGRVVIFGAVLAMIASVALFGAAGSRARQAHVFAEQAAPPISSASPTQAGGTTAPKTK